MNAFPVVGGHDKLVPNPNDGDVGLFDLSNPLWFYFLIDDDFTRITVLLSAVLMGEVTFFLWTATFEFLKFWFNTANL